MSKILSPKSYQKNKERLPKKEQEESPYYKT